MTNDKQDAMDELDALLTRELLNINVPYVLAALRIAARSDEHLSKCRDCLIDVAAIALNSLPPRYYGGGFRPMPPGVRSIAHSETEKEQLLRDAARQAVDAAIDIVKKNPHH